MKLFTPKQAQEQSKTQHGVDIVQIAYLETTQKRLQERINQENDNYTKRLKEQREAYTAEKIALQAELRELEAYVGRLRKEREALLIPIDSIKKEAEEMHSQAQSRLLKIECTEMEMEAKLESVSNKLDELADREMILMAKEAEMESRRYGIDMESKQVSDGHVKLNGMIAEFSVMSATKTKELADMKSRLDIEKRRANEYLEARTKELNEQERSLVDRRNALEREFNRLKKTNGR